MPWFHCFLSTIVSAYKEFEQRAGSVKNHRGAKTELARKKILSQVGEFSVSEIKQECPGVSHDMVRVIFRQLQEEKKIICLGKGKSSKWNRFSGHNT